MRLLPAAHVIMELYAFLRPQMCISSSRGVPDLPFMSSFRCKSLDTLAKEVETFRAIGAPRFLCQIDDVKLIFWGTMNNYAKPKPFEGRHHVQGN